MRREIGGSTQTDPRAATAEDRAKSRAVNYKINFTIQAARMVRAGVDPALLKNASRAGDDLWFWSLESLVTYIRGAAEHADTTVSEICQRIDECRSISI